MSAAKYEVDDDGGELKGADEDSLGTGSVTSDDELGSDKEFDDVEGVRLRSAGSGPGCC